MSYKAGRVSSALFGLKADDLTNSAPTPPQLTAFKFQPIEKDDSPKEESAGLKNKKRKREENDDEPQKKDRKKKADVTPEVPPKKGRDVEELRRTIIIKNVPVKETSKSLQKLLALSKEELESIRFRNLPVPQKFSNNKGLAKIVKSYTSDDATQTAFVVLKSADTMDKVLLKNGELHQGKHLLIDKACTEDKFSKFDKLRTVFVGRLGLKHDEDFLFNEFSQVAKVQSVRIVRDPKTQESKKFGFVCFEQKAAVAQAVATYAKKQFDGRNLRVTKVMKEDEAKAVQERKISKGRHGSPQKQAPSVPLNRLSKNKKRQAKNEMGKQGAARRVLKKSGVKKQKK